jgi:hypothetical protein
MSTVAHHAPAGTPAAVSGVLVGRARRVHDALDGVQAAIRDDRLEVTSRDVEELERIQRRVEAARLALIAKADRQQVRRRSGASSTSSWVAGVSRSTGGQASRDVTLATTLEAELPATRTALGAGELSAQHAGIIADTMGRLPESLTDEERTKVETSLVRDAKRLDPSRLRRAGLVALGAAERSAEEVAGHQEDVLADQERRAFAAAFLTMHDNGDGTTAGRFMVPTGPAQVLRKVLESMTAPRRNHLNKAGERGLADGQGPAGDVDDGSAAATLSSRNDDWDQLDWKQKRGRAFVDLLEHLPTDRLTGKVASTIVVTMTLEQLQGAAAAAELARASREGTGSDVQPGPSVGAVATDRGHQHSTGAARRLACNAGILPLVLGGASVPLDLGRQERFFSEAQRTALAALYDTCAAEGCDRPFAWSELHHEEFWSRGGRTDLESALPACGEHHRRVHDPGYVHSVTRDAQGRKTLRFRQRT